MYENKPNLNLYYSDTDSIVIDKELPSDIVGNKLGQLKLEHVIERGVFLAPKVYGFVDDKGEKVIKVKGIKSAISNTLTVNDLESLLIKDSYREFIQEKWMKNIFEGKINVDQKYYYSFTYKIIKFHNIFIY